eukprot:12936666-Prorocentrum_lima.AAC.1
MAASENGLSPTLEEGRNDEGEAPSKQGANTQSSRPLGGGSLDSSRAHKGADILQAHIHMCKLAASHQILIPGSRAAARSK